MVLLVGELFYWLNYNFVSFLLMFGIRVLRDISFFFIDEGLDDKFIRFLEVLFIIRVEVK